MSCCHFRSLFLLLALSAGCDWLPHQLMANQPAAGNRFAVIVAVRDYPRAKQLPALESSPRDAKRMRSALQRGGFADENIVLVYDEAESPQHRPTRQNILAAVQSVVSRATSEDLVLVATTSHGVSLEETSYLCPGDATDPALANAALAAEQLLAVPELADMLSKSSAARKLLVVDACRDASRSSTQHFVKPLATPPDGVWIMSSCSDSQYSYVSDQLRPGESHAVFSYFLADAFGGAADLVGNNNGDVSLLEAFSFAYAKTVGESNRLGVEQTPELFIGCTTPFVVTQVASLAPNRQLSSSNPEVEKRQTALLLADQGNRIIRQAETNFRDRFRAAQLEGDDAGAQAAYQDHYNQICYALGTYLKPALALDPQCKAAHLARGWSMRTSGLYRQALAEYQAAGESLELFVRGDSSDLAQYIDESEGDARMAIPDSHTSPAVATVSFYDRRPAAGKPTSDSSTIQVPKHSKIRVAAIDGPAEEWLEVTAVDDQPLAKSAWVHRQYVHWFSEAVDVYAPRTPMNRRWNGERIPAVLGRLDQASESLESVAVRLEQPVERIESIRERLYSRPAYQVGSAILSRFGIANPIETGLGYAEHYVGLPASYVRMAQGYVQFPAAYLHVASGFVNVVQDYRVGIDESNSRTEQRQQLLSAKLLQPVAEKAIEFRNSPWKETTLK